MKFIKKNKFTIMAIIIFIAFLIAGVKIKEFLVPDEGKAVYGDRLNEIEKQTNFLLNKISYYWLKDNGKGQEEIAIYTANNNFEFETYSELKKNSQEINLIIEDHLMKKVLKKI